MGDEGPHKLQIRGIEQSRATICIGLPQVSCGFTCVCMHVRIQIQQLETHDQ